MIRNSRTVFIFVTMISYFGLILVPSSQYAIIPVIVFFIITKKYIGDIKKTLFISAVFTLPYLWGKSLWKTPDSSLLVISPFTFFVALLSILALWEKVKINTILPSIFLYLFFIWSIISFLFANPYLETADGILKVGLSLIFYFLSIEYLKDNKVKKITVFLFISFIVFQGILVFGQNISGHPLGLFIEEATDSYPFGKVASEDISLYRPSGTMGSPTWLSRLLVMLLPFVLFDPAGLIQKYKRGRVLLILLLMITIFATFTRVGWVSSILVLVLYLCMRREEVRKFLVKNKN